MYVSHVHLDNIRSFQKLEFDLGHSPDAQGKVSHAGWVVFVGDNGSGKSTLLKAIAAGLLRQKYLDVLEPNLKKWLRERAHKGRFDLFLVRQTDDDCFEKQKQFPAEALLWSAGIALSSNIDVSDEERERLDPLIQALENDDNSTLDKFARNLARYSTRIVTTSNPDELKKLGELGGQLFSLPDDAIKISLSTVKDLINHNEEIKKIEDDMYVELCGNTHALAVFAGIVAVANGPLSEHSTGWFSCGYGPFRRVFGASQEALQLMTGEVVERFATLFNEAASLYEADRWLRDLKYKALEGNAAAKQQLDVVLELLRDEFMPNQITLKEVNSDGLWLEDRNGTRLAWRDMSDGYRAALALLCDILRHLIRKFGVEGLTARNAEGHLYVTRSGVVLIDEVDAHLHPEWQRKISGWLKGHFPNIQFLVTTHSPLICQEADKIFVLPAPGSDDKPFALSAEEYLQVVASKSDAVLRSSAFGLDNTRSETAVKKRSQYSRLRSKQRAGATLSDAEQAELTELQAFVDADADN